MNKTMILDIDNTNLEDMVFHNSEHFPVLVAFWQPNDPAIEQTLNILEKLAEKLSGRFILAKVNSKKETRIAEKFGIEQKFVCRIIVKSETVKELEGIQTEETYLAALEEFMVPDASEEFRAQAQVAFENGEMDATIKLLGQAYEADNTNFKVHLDLVRMYFQSGDIDKANDLIAKLPDVAKESKQGKSLIAIFNYTSIIAEVGDINTIQKRLQENPEDSEALYGLFAFLMLHDQVEKGIQSLLKLFVSNRDFKNGTPQKELIALFSLLQEDQPEIVNHYRQQFQNLLY